MVLTGSNIVLTVRTMQISIYIHITEVEWANSRMKTRDPVQTNLNPLMLKTF